MLSRVPIGAAVLLLALLAGCSSDPPGVGARPSGTGSSTTGPADDSASDEPTATTPATPATPDVVPATGPALLLDDLGKPVLRLHLPEEIEWRVQPSRTFASGDYPDGTFVDITVSSTGIVTGKPYGFYADITANSIEIAGPQVRRQDDRTVQGVKGFALEGKNASGLTYAFGTVRDGSQAAIIFEFPHDGDKARRWIESVLASVEWL